MATYEIEIKTSQQNLDIGSPGASLDANLEVYNDKVGLIIPNDFPTEIPGGVIEVDDTLIVRLINDLPAPIATGIHWHGIELQNNADGTPVTQGGVPGGDLQELGGLPGDSVGGTYLYKFKVTRPGIFWFHPHHFHSTNRVFRGSYGMLIVKDLAKESTLISNNILPLAANTHTRQLILSDTTVCKAPGMNIGPTYNPPATNQAEWLSDLTAQLGPTPKHLCEIVSPAEPDNIAMNEDGSPAMTSFGVDDIPNIQRASPVMSGQRTVEGQTVLTNGHNVGGRDGTPLLIPGPGGTPGPGMIDGTAIKEPILSGQGLRLQIVNCATVRYFRLLLTTEAGAMVNLVRVGGEGGLLDKAILEGGNSVGPDNFNFKYDEGEILIPPASRADIVAAIPAGLPMGSVLTLWTRDFERTGGGYSGLPTVPVLHLEVTGNELTTFSINAGDNILQSLFPIGPKIEDLVSATDNLLNPGSFSPPKIGQLPTTVAPLFMEDISLTAGGGVVGIDGISGSFSGGVPYTNTPHLTSTRFAKRGDLLELRIRNESGAHHPFHLHGFSFQPKSLTGPGLPTYDWPYQEFRDNLDIPSQYILTFIVRIDDHVFADEITMGGALGRWLFHCHIFFHAHLGMISELVITDVDGSGDEKPNIDVRGSWTYTPTVMMPATRSGTYFLPDGDTLRTIIAHYDTGIKVGNITITSGSTWDWTSLSITDPPLPNLTEYIYVTITGNSGRKDQTVFRLLIGGGDQGSDNGDPHIHTVDGKRYDFQAVGEFTLLKDREGMEIQARQTPVLTANPNNDPYSGLKACVSLNTAVAARVGSHRVAYQPIGDQGELQFYLDGKPARLTTAGIDLDGNHVSGFNVNGQTALRIDYAQHTVVTVTPLFWNSHGLWFMNISISHTQGNEGIMGPIYKSSWLPKLRSGADLGPMPESLNDRYVALYKIFADSWRVTNQSSLFVYESGTSTATFTDKNWPAQEPPCTLKPQFEIPGAPLPAGTDIANATLICQGVTDVGLNQDCIFDVATTGDAEFAQGYLILQDLKLNGTSIQVISDIKSISEGESVTVMAIVLPLRNGRPTPKGKVSFYIDGTVSGPSINLGTQGEASKVLSGLSIGKHKIRATYDSVGADGYHPSGSPSVLIAVEKGADKPKKPWYLWLILILIILLLLILIIFLIN